MATDGVKIIDGDTAHDTYWGIMDLYDSGADFGIINNEFPLVQAEYFDDFDNEIYVTACGLALWEIGQMTEDKLTYIKSIIEKGNIQCSILLSSFFRENKKYERWCEELITYSNTKENVNVSFAVNHAKVFLAKTKDNRYIVFEGSGNLSDNARIEQYLIEDNEITYNFHKEWIINTLNLKK